MPSPQSPFLGQDRHRKKAARPTRNGAVRVRPLRSDIHRRGESQPLRGRPVRRQEVGAGAVCPLTQVRRTVLLAANRDGVCAAVSDFLLCGALGARSGAGFMRNRRIIFASSHYPFFFLRLRAVGWGLRSGGQESKGVPAWPGASRFLSGFGPWNTLQLNSRAGEHTALGEVTP